VTGDPLSLVTAKKLQREEGKGKGSPFHSTAGERGGDLPRFQGERRLSRERKIAKGGRMAMEGIENVQLKKRI